MEINTAGYQCKMFSPAPEKEGKGWSYSNVYYLRDIKDIYLVLLSNSELSSALDVCLYCGDHGIVSESGKKWTERGVLEVINALRNFGLISLDSLNPLRGKLFDAEINKDLKPRDLVVFKRIYYHYFRFQDFISLFRKKDGGKLGTVFYYMENSRFVNRFIKPDSETVFYIEDSHSEIMRFWDVFLKWGLCLNVLDRISNIETISGQPRSLSAAFFIEPMPKSFSIVNAIVESQLGSYVYIPDAIRDIALKYHYSTRSLVRKIIEECEDSERFRLQSTSAIFVPRKDKDLFPVVDNTYMSHLLKL